MKRYVSLVAVLLFILTSVSAFGLEWEDVKRMSNSKLYAAIKGMSATDLAAFWNTAATDTNANATLQSRVKTQLTKYINSMPAWQSKEWSLTLYENTSNLNFTLGNDGKYTITIAKRTENGAINNGTGYIPRTEDTAVVSLPPDSN